jgi:DNA end-binding protein Ku
MKDQGERHAASCAVTLAFGLVNLPVRLYTAAASKKVTFRLLDRTTGQRVRQQLVSPGQPPREKDQGIAAASEATALRAPASTAVSSDPIDSSALEEEGSGSPAEFVVPRQQIIKGYEIERNRYIEVTADELKALEAEANQHAEIQEFVSLAQIDPVSFEKAYYLGPDKGGEKVYRLFARALRKQRRGAIAKLVMRGKEKLVLVRPVDEDRLVLEMLYYADEVRDASEIYVPDVALSDAEVQLAEQVIESLSMETWEPKKFKDTYRERVMALIEQKHQGKPFKSQRVSSTPKVIDLMEALRASLATAAKRPTRRRPKPQRRTQSTGKIQRAG